MDKHAFNILLKTAGLSKKEFAEILGTTGGTISNWGNEDREIPYWVESWLALYIENQHCKKIKEAIKESGVCEVMDKKSK
ncbi:MAG: helix-turn-helix transcriptional regulator [Sulfuricurvum sp.]|uniref:helix-turn-helix domain-containing protein n=1 Tax=Sulfuricurvum sp. TaxID=2025608 RepID=UPI002615B191|nr:helix-turn-helix transcriptional regulator [Sulfuricurvum sp.]MDD2829813.1 helix-turn-helix transcriptional regulator [Sulfuricurvum sp.]MDD4950278.1 helix-turn-helix transcriptional regulator [Sulfuricurvum sp.]